MNKFTSNCFSTPIPKNFEKLFNIWHNNFKNKYAEYDASSGIKREMGSKYGVMSFFDFATPFDSNIQNVADYLLLKGVVISLDAWLSEDEVIRCFILMDEWNR